MTTATGRIDFDRISDGATLLEAAEDGTLDCFVDMPSANVDDLLLLADWGASYEFGEETEQRESMARAIGHLMREVQKRQTEARVRQVAKILAKKHGLRAGEKRVVDAARKWVAENPS